MTEEDATHFNNSYIRSKKVNDRLNEYARNKYLAILKEEENIQALNIPNYSEFMASKMSERRVWREVQELTRTL
jgi:hypothetical protein